MKHALGVDIGGTKISMVLGNDRGKILTQRIIPTLTGKETRRGVSNLVSGLEELKKNFKGRLAGIGVGIPGPVDSAKGIVPRSPHLGGWEGLKLRQILSSRLKLPVRMGNDANAAGLGEKNFGQGRNKKNFIYVTVSTGIGGGIVIDGKLLEGASYVAGEIGHMTIVPKGAPCKCGKLGCLEAYGSGTAIARMGHEEYKKAGKLDALRRLTEGRLVSAKDLGIAAKKGDKLADEVYARAGFYLGIGLANLLNTINPEMIILGGGVWRSSPKSFWNAMMKSCRAEAWPQAWDAVRIVRSTLEGHSGDLGALALGFEAKS